LEDRAALIIFLSCPVILPIGFAVSRWKDTLTKTDVRARSKVHAVRIAEAVVLKIADQTTGAGIIPHTRDGITAPFVTGVAWQTIHDSLLPYALLAEEGAAAFGVAIPIYTFPHRRTFPFIMQGLKRRLHLAEVAIGVPIAGAYGIPVLGAAIHRDRRALAHII